MVKISSVAQLMFRAFSLNCLVAENYARSVGNEWPPSRACISLIRCAASLLGFENSVLARAPRPRRVPSEPRMGADLDQVVCSYVCLLTHVKAPIYGWQTKLMNISGPYPAMSGTMAVMPGSSAQDTPFHVSNHGAQACIRPRMDGRIGEHI
jgi:hypothetical protein